MSDEHAGNGSLKVSTLAGTFEARGSSTLVIIVVMFLMGFVGLGYLIHQHDQRHEQRTERLIEAVEVLTYINTLPPERRAQLDLRTPRALRALREREAD